ncbi:MAG: type II toxin-antitoxin system MqsA family antitoxin [Selenomonadaceae bacterium]|nr:type II toxin-antitoxin system MqsA family antitoxin [Selenomonadaceae bacterium]
MSCFYCKGDIVHSTTVYTAQIGNAVIVIKNVPCEECDQCGEIEISHEVMLKIDHIIDLATQLVQDVAVIDYQSAA